MFNQPRYNSKQSTCQVTEGAHDSVPDDSSPEAHAETDVIATFADSVSIIVCPRVTVVDGEHTLTPKTSTECYMNRAHPYIHVIVRKFASLKDDRLETNVLSASSGMVAIDGHEVLREFRVSFSTALVPHL